MDKKIELGQFFTKSDVWLKPQIVEFIKNSNCSIVYDPFAGNGDILNVCLDKLDFQRSVGLDIDSTLDWEINDSLNSIPYIKDAIIITNPPYLAKNSATRKKLDSSKYFINTCYEDLYLLALDKMLETRLNVVAIIPESFIHSNFKQMNKLSSITILEDNPFEDTEIPICIACFDNIEKDYSKIKIYKNNNFIMSLKSFYEMKLMSKNNLEIKFNDKSGWLALRAIDSSNDKDKILFDFKENICYNWVVKLKQSSRNYSLINIEVEDKQTFINKCNILLNELRESSQDIVLSAFKGNTKSNKRRRRLDFKLARAIMEKAYEEMKGE